MQEDETYPPRISRKQKQQTNVYDGERNRRHYNYDDNHFDDHEQNHFSSEYNNGFDNGYEEGYRQGYHDAYGDHEHNIKSLNNGHPENMRWHKRKSSSWYWL